MGATLRAFWQRRGPANAALLPLSHAFGAIVRIRRALYRKGILRTVRLPVPVIVAGSIVAGGSGKSPLVQALAAGLGARGLRTGIIARGYGGSAREPRLVRPADDPLECGDEPVMHAQQACVPVAVGADRPAAAQLLLREHPDTQALISDDGLQHYALARNFEIAALGADGIGNGWLLPAGPLREQQARLKECDAVVRKQGAQCAPGEWTIKLDADGLVRLADGQRIDASALAGKKIAAIAGIAEPQGFFSALEQLGLQPAHAIAYPDHHRFVRENVGIPDADAVVMTAKDAVKCRAFADLPLYALQVRPSVPDGLIDAVMERISASDHA